MRNRMKSIIAIMIVVLMVAQGIVIPVSAAGVDPYDTFNTGVYDGASDNGAKITKDAIGAKQLTAKTWIVYRDVDFGEAGPYKVELMSRTPEGNYPDFVELRLDDPNAEAFVQIPITPNEGWTNPPVLCEAWVTSKVTGVHDLYLYVPTKNFNAGTMVFREKKTEEFNYEKYSVKSSFSDVEDVELHKTLNLLTQLDIVEENEDNLYMPEAPTNRADFAKSIYRLFVEKPSEEDSYAPPTEEEGKEVKSKFDDVKSDSEFAEAINYLSENGIMNGVSETEFKPYSFITYVDAVTVLVRVLGYKELADMEGGYPNGYIKTATKEKLVTGTVPLDEYLGRDDMASLLERTINAKYLDMDSFTVDGYVNFIRNEGILNLTQGIKKGSGKVTANPLTRVLMSGSELAFNQVAIGDEIYYVGDTLVSSMVGIEVDYWYSEVNGEKVLRALVPQSGVEITELSSAQDEIESISDSEIIFTKAGETKKETIDISSAAVIYNGVAAEGSLEDAVNSETDFKGFLSIIENHDGSFVVIIDEYMDIEIESIDPETEVIKAKKNPGETDTFFVYASGEENYVIMKNNIGEDISVKQLESGDILTVYQSKNKGKKLVRAYPEVKEITGTIDKIEDGNIFIDGQKYVFSNRYDGIDSIGTQRKFYLNMYGEVVKSIAIDGVPQVGLYFRHSKSYDGFKWSTEVKIITTEGKTVIHPVADRVIIDGSKMDSMDRTITLLDGLRKESPIRYKLNAEGKISMIDTPGEATDDPNNTLIELEAPGVKMYYEAAGSYLVGVTNSISHPKFYCEGTSPSFGFKAVYTDETAGSDMRAENCVAAAVKDVMRRGWTIDGGAYSTTGNDKVADLVIDRDILDGLRYSFTSRVVVDGLSTDINSSGEVVEILKAVNGGEEVKYTLTEDFMNSELIISNKAMGITYRDFIENLKKGDFINVTTQSTTDKVMLGIVPIMYADAAASRTIKGVTITTTINRGQRETAHTTKLEGVYLYGKVTDRGSSYIIADVMDSGNAIPNLISLSTASVVEVYKRGDAVLVKGGINASAIEVNDTVFVYFDGSGRPSQIIIYANGGEADGGAEL